MIWLALETATPTTSVALLRGADVVASVDDDSGRPHSERLLLAIEELWARAGESRDAVEAYAVSVGPGSFTGLRIGVATAQGFALVDGRPAQAVPTLAALAVAADGAPAAALLDARRGEVYAAGYSDPWSAEADLLAEGLYRPEAMAGALPEATSLV
nr:tRNA (adenosine(37)-N6)-threonylcarbamoyltransferase complex dimerization subunit type 1 TsaB [Myxococcota bacterium]